MRKSCQRLNVLMLKKLKYRNQNSLEQYTCSFQYEYGSMDLPCIKNPFDDKNHKKIKESVAASKLATSSSLCRYSLLYFIHHFSLK
jgi:hypothetical protein